MAVPGGEGRAESAAGALQPQHDGGAGTPSPLSKTRLGLEGDRAWGQWTAWPHTGQKLPCCVSPGTERRPDDCNMAQSSLLPYHGFLLYQMARAYTQGAHLKRFLLASPATK